MAAENGCLAFSAVAFVTHVQMATRQKGVVFTIIMKFFVKKQGCLQGPRR